MPNLSDFFKSLLDSLRMKRASEISEDGILGQFISNALILVFSPAFNTSFYIYTFIILFIYLPF